MNFISYKNQLNFDCIDFKNNTIGFIVGNDVNESFVAFIWTGGVVFFMDYADDLGNFVDYNFIGEVIHSTELSDNVDKEVLKVLEYNKEYIIEYIAQQTYIKEMGNRRIVMKTYNVEYKIGMFGCINLDVDMDLPRDHPEFMRVLNEKADEIVKNEVLCYGAVDFIHTRD